MSHRVVLTLDLNLYFINRCRCVRGGSLIWLCWFFFIALLLHLPKYVCTVYFLMDALASVKLDNKSLLTKKNMLRLWPALFFFARNHFCFTDWAMIDDNKRRGVFVTSRGHFRLPDCEILPKYDNSTASKHCTRTSITTMKWDLATSKFLLVRLYFYVNLLKFFQLLCFLKRCQIYHY